MYHYSSDYIEILRFLSQSGTSWTLAEIQGVLLGYLATAQDPDYQEWFALIQEDLEIENPDLDHALKRLFLENHLNLTQNSPLTLCIVDDQTKHFQEQLSALRDLARGMLYAIGAVAQQESLDLVEGFQEMLSDLIQISQIDVDMIENHNPEDYKACLDHLILVLRELYEMSR